MATTAERLDRLERFMGVSDIEGPQLSQLTDDEFQALRAAAPDLPNGEDNFAIDAVQQNRIQRDLRKDINTLTDDVIQPLTARVAKLEARTSGSGGSVTLASLNAVLNPLHIYIASDPETGISYLSIGGPPDFDSQSPLQIGWKFAAEIGGYSDTMRVEGQGSGANDSCNTCVIADGDGGIRFRQYLKWGKNGKKRNTLSRPATILALDSVGELCCSQEEIGSNDDGGQNWYVKMDWARRLVRFVTFKPGWRPTIERCSTNYADADERLL